MVAIYFSFPAHHAMPTCFMSVESTISITMALRQDQACKVWEIIKKYDLRQDQACRNKTKYVCWRTDEGESH